MGNLHLQPGLRAAGITGLLACWAAALVSQAACGSCGSIWSYVYLESLSLDRWLGTPIGSPLPPPRSVACLVALFALVKFPQAVRSRLEDPSL